MTPCMQVLQGEMTEVVAQGKSNVVELHREVQDVVESRDLPVNRDVTKEVGGPRRSCRNVLRHFLLDLTTRRGLKRECDTLKKSLRNPPHGAFKP